MFVCFDISLIAQKTNISLPAYSEQVGESSIFKVAQPDFKTSPFTGMTRKHWKDAGMYLLQGAFSYIHQLDDPMKFPKQPGKSYPRNEGQVPTEKLEGLCRTLLIAAPLLKEDSNLVINNIRLADYYRHQVRMLIDSLSPSYIKHRAPNGGPSQNLVEFGALSLSLFAIPNLLWEPLSKNEKDALAATMISYGDGPTVPSNWKFFNIFVLSFYKSKGYAVNEKLLEEYLQKSLQHYRGDGWYNDNPAFDYYSMWAFQMYGVVWSEFFGKQYYPQYANQFLENFKAVKDSYPYMFGRDGKMIMWGRSMSYRFGSTVPFPLMGFANVDGTNFGWMRRIASGTILQFLQNPEFLKDRIPTLGFYGAFEPAVQSYSCRGSVFWMGKAFLGLLVPADNPFWTSKENEGPWANEFDAKKVYNKFLPGPKIMITDYPSIGASEIRAWCHVKEIGASESYRSSENYNRLSYNSAFPWQADGPNGEVAMSYVFRNRKGAWEPLRLYDFKKFDDGVFYRSAVLETDSTVQFHLADIPLPNGILRIDQIISEDSISTRLGHYALPQLSTEIKESSKKLGAHNATIISNGVYQLAMVPLSAWQQTEIVHTQGLHPEAPSSVVINASAKTAGGKSTVVFATLLLWKNAKAAFKNDELMPVKTLKIAEDQKSVIVLFRDGSKKLVSFE